MSVFTSSRVVTGGDRRRETRRSPARLSVALVVMLLAGFALNSTPSANGAMTAAAASTPIAGQCLVVVNSASSNPFGHYLGEILRTEGYSSCGEAELSTLTSQTLAGYPVVLLAETSLSVDQASVLTGYVSSGGTLIAMRPDPQLAPVFGLTPAAGTTSEAYILVNTGHPVGAGLTGQTMQTHAVADHYTVAGATVVATVFADASTSTTYPAVVMNSYGAGRGAAFTYDLAKAIAYLRQGNPAWAGSDRDGDGVVRTIDGFIGWSDLSRVQIPQADEQQRLLSNVMTYFARQTVPSPKLWYFPTTAQKTMLVVTGDDHGSGASAFQDRINVVESHGGRMTFYIYGSSADNASLQAWQARGHEFGIHAKAHQSGITLSSAYSIAFSALTSKGIPGIPSTTERNHQVEWQGWVDAAKVAQSYGELMSTDFYHWGFWLHRPDGSWIPTGYITGSGLPMRFVDQTGSIIPVYQQHTELVDEHMLLGLESAYAGLTPDQAIVVSQQLIDASLGGYYSAITMQAHVDLSNLQWLDGVLAYAQTRNVPIWTAQRWANFTQARHDASVSQLAWDPTALQLSFQFTTSAQEPSTLLIPSDYLGHPTSAVTVDGQASTQAIEYLKGFSYVPVTVSGGSHNIVVSYSPTGVATATPLPTQTATPTATMTSTPTPQPGSVLASSGYEETSFAAGGWNLDLSGNQSTVKLVTSPVFSGSQAARFSVATQANGETARAIRGIAWPSSNVVVARSMVQVQSVNSAGTISLTSLENQGPNKWAPRAGFAIAGPTSIFELPKYTFGVLYRSRDGVSHIIDTYHWFVPGIWYELVIRLDNSGPSPVARYFVNGDLIYTYTDTSTGNDTDPPNTIAVGLSAWNWGANAASIVVDDTVVQDGNPSGIATPTPTSTPTATATSTPTSTPTATPVPGTVSLVDTSVADFTACAVPAGLVVANEAGGELRLAATLEDYFDSALSATQWAWGTWIGGTYTPAPSGGVLPVQSTVGSAWVRSTASFSQQTVEGRVSFGSGPWEHFGWGTAGFNTGYAMISTFNTSDTLFARTSADGALETRTQLTGVTLNAYHLVRIVWQPTKVDYYVDGTLVASHTLAVTSPMYVYLSNNSASGTLQADWARVSSYQIGSVAYTSCVKDAVTSANWGTLTATGQQPATTGVLLQTRSSIDGLAWSPWAGLGAGGSITSPAGRYIQYQATLSTTSTSDSPSVDSVTIAGVASSAATPTATPTATATSTPTATATATATATPTSAPAATATPTDTPTATATATPTATPTSTPTATPTSTPTSTPTATPTPASLFVDGFESGNFSAWSQTGGTAGRITVTSGAAQAGTYKMQAQVSSGLSGYVQDNSPASATSYHARFYINPNSYSTGSSAIDIFDGLNSSNATAFRVQYRRGNGSAQVRLVVTRAGGSSSTTWYAINTSAWTAVEIAWQSGGSASASLYTGGVLRQTLSGLNTSSFALDTVRLGPQGSLPTASGFIYLDSFASTLTTVIGP